MSDVSEVLRAAVHAELAAIEAAQLDPTRRKRGAGDIGPSRVLSVRLDPSEVAALTRRAELYGMKPGALARNLLRSGLSNPPAAQL